MAWSVVTKEAIADFNCPTPERVIWALVFLVVMGCISCAFLALTLAAMTDSKSSCEPAPADVIVAILTLLVKLAY